MNLIEERRVRMNVLLWIIASLLAVVFLGAGANHLLRPKDKLAAAGMTWTNDVSAGSVKLLGALEILAAVGLILPGVTGIAPILVPLAALGLVVVMAGAVVVHARRKETPIMVGTVVLLILAALVAWGRFGPYSL
jgi:drug/metabolite transporter (DMT)-like permease